MLSLVCNDSLLSLHQNIEYSVANAAHGGTTAAQTLEENILAGLRLLPDFEGWSGKKNGFIDKNGRGSNYPCWGLFHRLFQSGPPGSTLAEKPRGNQSKYDDDSFITLNSGECDGRLKTTLNGRVHFNVAPSPKTLVLKELEGKMSLRD
ncbi:hypothetical protein AVEN_247883-1 [Araneus ventricosus]|uniref:Uncharacterized protein n=1 Tax=Araneus ventricosus TaxID=182803 RepID=A0A4Y2HSZ3_ARAVE|nr:hypothetical protein AVEN_247883-1 [Araneus ventricosus]